MWFAALLNWVEVQKFMDAVMNSKLFKRLVKGLSYLAWASLDSLARLMNFKIK